MSNTRSTLEPQLEAAIQQISHDGLREAVREYLRANCLLAIRGVELLNDTNYLEVGWIDWFLGRRKSEPILDQLVCKCGGLPYLEDPDEWPVRGGERATFVGQLNFAEVESSIEHLPERGILTVYLSSHESSQDEMFEVRWYPDASEVRCLPLEWPQPSVEVERRIELIPAYSYELPTLWEDVLPGDLADLSEVDGLEPLADVVWELTGNIGALPFFGLDGPGPRYWLDEDSCKYDDWLVLFHPLEGWWGSMQYTLMIRRDDLEVRRFENARTLCWQ